MSATYQAPEAASFWVDFTIRDDVIALHGELDLASAPTLEAALELVEVTSGEVVFDLADLAFIDSIGLTRLVRAHKTLQARGGGLVIRNPAPRVRRVFAVSGLDRVFRIEEA